MIFTSNEPSLCTHTHTHICVVAFFSFVLFSLVVES